MLQKQKTLTRLKMPMKMMITARIKLATTCDCNYFSVSTSEDATNSYELTQSEKSAQSVSDAYLG